MKRNAISRIIVYCVLALVLTGMLVTGLVGEQFFYNQDNVPQEGHVAANTVNNLEINWAGGTVSIEKSNSVDHIAFYETAPDGCKYKMTYTCENDTLAINYGGKYAVLGSSSGKDLTISVPMDWRCDTLVINGAGLDINMLYMNMGTLEVNGAGCEITLALPQSLGFLVQRNGLGCQLTTSLPMTKTEDGALYGDGACKIIINGLGCEVIIPGGTPCVHEWSPGYPVVVPGTEEQKYVYTCIHCGENKEE